VAEGWDLLKMHSGTEQGQDRKDLASTYVLHPLDLQVLVFQGWVELSPDGVWAELTT
jgi:hypothetical protein